jgi:hypothetical protein
MTLLYLLRLGWGPWGETNYLYRLQCFNQSIISNHWTPQQNPTVLWTYLQINVSQRKLSSVGGDLVHLIMLGLTFSKAIECFFQIIFARKFTLVGSVIKKCYLALWIFIKWPPQENSRQTYGPAGGQINAGTFSFRLILKGHTQMLLVSIC